MCKKVQIENFDQVVDFPMERLICVLCDVRWVVNTYVILNNWFLWLDLKRETIEACY